MNKPKLLGVYAILMLVFASSGFAWNMNIDVSQSSISGKACGSTYSLPVSVRNDGTGAGVLCWYWSDLDSTVKKGTPECVDPEGGLGTFNTQFSLPQSPGQNTLYIACRNYGRFYLVTSYNDCEDDLTWDDPFLDGFPETAAACNNFDSSTGVQRDGCLGKKSISVNCYYCGDGNKDSGETCSSCPQDVSCGAYEKCVSGVCKTYCGNGQCESSESCSSCPGDCGQCCGNGRTDSGENCQTCPADIKCSSNQACSPGGECIPLGTDENCGAIGHTCDTQKREGSVIRTYCQGNTQAVQVKEVTSEKCINKQCQLQKEEKEIPTNCISPTHYCQDGSCGCSRGYSECQTAGKCAKMGEFELNGPCSCDFQCETDFCYNGKCSKALSTSLKASKTVAQEGEQVDITISLVNELDEDIKAQLILESGSGVTITRSDGADVCTSAQCATYDTISGRNTKSITLMVHGEQSAEVDLKGQIKYTFEGKDHYIPLTETITFISCGNHEAEVGETQQNCCLDVPCTGDTALYSFVCIAKTKACERKFQPHILYGSIGAVITVILLVFGGVKFAAYKRKTAPEREKAKKEVKAEREQMKEESEAKQRKAAREALEILFKEVNPNKPPSLREVKNKLSKQLDLEVADSILREEYLAVLGNLERKHRKVEEATEKLLKSHGVHYPHEQLEKLEGYIKAALLKGYTQEQVTAGLLNAGWPQDAIDGAFEELESKAEESVEPSKPKSAPEPEKLSAKKNFCGKCGAEITGREDFCGKCGAKA